MDLPEFLATMRQAAVVEAERKARIEAERQKRISELISTAGSLRAHFKAILPEGAPVHAYTDETLGEQLETLERVLEEWEQKRACTTERPCGLVPCTHGIPQLEWAEYYWTVREALCPRYMEVARRAAIEQRKQEAKVPSRFQEASFANFVVTPSTRRAVDVCRQYAETLERGEGRGLFIAGDVGTGKTHLAVAVLFRVIERGFEGRFLVVPEWLHRLRRSFDDGTGSHLWEVMEHPGLLVLDDIGTEKPSEWVEEQMFLLVNHRYQHRLPTVYTSNLGLDELQERLGARTVSRIIETCDGVLLKGEDYRKRKLRGEAS